jgi:hypothetical protein
MPEVHIAGFLRITLSTTFDLLPEMVIIPEIFES